MRRAAQHAVSQPRGYYAGSALIRCGWVASLLLASATDISSQAVFAQQTATIAQPEASAAAVSTEEAERFFETRVRPLLAAKCWECHSDGSVEGGLKLTDREAILEGGDQGPAVVPGDPGSSLLMAAVHRSSDLAMPPDAPLRADEIQALSDWITTGAVWPASNQAAPVRKEFSITSSDRDHWAFRPLTDPPRPVVAQSEGLTRDLDFFVVSQLEQRGLELAPLADRRTLLRRVYFDLIGLPPTPEELDQFLADPRSTPEAFAEVVDRLLASPRYGERWGRHWLDVARFADTKDGVLMFGDDRIRPFAYTYRDYVIRAFNEDLPYDQFVSDQIAADLADPPVPAWRLAGLGLLTLGRMYDNNVHDVIDDQIDVVTRGFLGLTIACARCHDHKYDPISTADYYALYGVFSNCEVPLDLPRIDDQPLSEAAAAFETTREEKRQAIESFLDEQYRMLRATARERTPDYLVRVATTKPDPIETAIFFLSLAPEDLRPQIVARWRRTLVERAVPSDPLFGIWHDLSTLYSAATAEGNPLAEQVAQVLERWSSRPRGIGAGEVSSRLLDHLRMAPPTDLESLARSYGQLMVSIDAEVRAAGREQDSTVDPETRAWFDLLNSYDAPAYFTRSQTRRYMSRQQTDQFGGMLTEFDRIAVQATEAAPRAMVVADRSETQEPRIFVRGNPSQPGTPVPRRFPELLEAARTEPFGSGSGRKDLAQALVSTQNPLTARVLVNRVWMHHFGEPLVSSPSDFGLRSTPPVHAELLDHLASAFMREGWSLKWLHREILLSRTWCQSSEPSQSMAQRAQTLDPENQFLWKARRRRLDLEAMRDSMLFVSKTLVDRQGGRPVDLANDPNATARTVYGLVDRQSLPGMYRAFDFASPDVSAERRPRTVVPQQALFALNSPLILEQSRRLAQHAASAHPGDDTAATDERIRWLVRHTWLREPSSEETTLFQEFLAAPADAQTTSSNWERLAQIMITANEWSYVD